MCPNPAKLLFLYLWFPLAVIVLGKKWRPLPLWPLRADASALEWVPLCAVESVARDAKRRWLQLAWFGHRPQYLCVRSRAGMSCEWRKTPPWHCSWLRKDDPPPHSWRWWSGPHSINHLRGWQGLGCSYVGSWESSIIEARALCCVQSWEKL